MVMIKDNKGIERYSLPQRVYDLLMRAKEKITHEDQEFWVCFGGDTGCGKSLMAMRWMFVLFPEIEVKHICFTKDEFIDAVLSAKKGTGIILDEGISILFSRGSMTKEGRLIAELIAQIRQKNLAIFLNIPEPLALDWTAQRKMNVYVHVWESRSNLSGKPTTLKGNAAIYPEITGKPYRTKIFSHMRRKKSNPMMTKRRPEPYCTVKGNPIGRNHKKPWYPVPEPAYREKKEGVLKKYGKKEVVVPKHMQQLRQIAYLFKKYTKKTYREIEDMTGIPKSTLSDWNSLYKGTLGKITSEGGK